MSVPPAVRWGRLNRAQLAADYLSNRIGNGCRIAVAPQDDSDDTVLIQMITREGKYVRLSEPYDEFPSEQLLAQLTLVA